MFICCLRDPLTIRFGKIVGTISGGLPIAAIATTLEGLEKLSAEL